VWLGTGEAFLAIEQLEDPTLWIIGTDTFTRLCLTGALYEFVVKLVYFIYFDSDTCHYFLEQSRDGGRRFRRM
jgi:hypothetical protein